MNRAQRRQQERMQAKQPRSNFMSDIIDLSEVKRKADAREAVPPYEIGNPVFALQTGIRVAQGEVPSFTEVIEDTAVELGTDGWAITELVEVSFAGLQPVSEAEALAMFRVVVKVKSKHAEQAVS